MIIYSTIMYQVEKKRFGWYRVYEDGVLYAKFKYQASAVNFVDMKWHQYLEHINNQLQKNIERGEKIGIDTNCYEKRTD